MRLGEAIRRLRELRGYTQREVAAQLGVSDGFLSHLEKGRRGISNPYLNALAEALAVPVWWLMFLGTPRRSEEGDPIGQLMTRVDQIMLSAVALEGPNCKSETPPHSPASDRRGRGGKKSG